MQHVVDSELGRPPFRCPAQALTCAAREPPGWPALVQVPGNEARALTPLHPWRCDDASSEEENNNCPAAVLITGRKRQLAERLGRGLFPRVPAEYYLGTDDASDTPDYFEMFSRVVPASTAYLKLLLGAGAEIHLEYLKEMPKPETRMMLDLTTLLSALFFTWIVQLLLPVSWFGYSLESQLLSCIEFILSLVNVSMIFLEHWLVKMQLFPAFSLYRGIYDLAGYAYAGRNMGKPEKTNMRSMIICNNLKKVYAGKNGNPDKIAVRGLSLALYRGQCFGMLGPSGSGKTSFINMVSDNS
ncbi:hypothetical protein HU200_035959 [Digitaria exilis]|uniref:ABC transporter domain-containing protein n=1 Tax=Digitaria exilis TaxID=1010633 RepID=A0A835BH38_9POAL|nr:hypothetical protein HU200_035959 [Digitaria exilis]